MARISDMRCVVHSGTERWEMGKMQRENVARAEKAICGVALAAAMAIIVVVVYLMTQVAAPTDYGTMTPSSRPSPAPVATVFIAEDDPRWDCHTMGNRICGPQFRVERRNRMV